MDRIAKLSLQKPVVIFNKSRCCMCHAIKRLFLDQGVSPMIHELDEDVRRGREIELALATRLGWKLVGPAQAVMTLHLDGSLKKMLIDAGALWL